MSDKEKNDDMRTIANMNVDGMPWYVQGDENRQMGRSSVQHYQMTKQESRMYTWAAVKAGLLVVLVFGAVFFLFLLFCDFVWFA